MSEGDLTKALQGITPPCELFRCRRYNDCAVQEMACESYVTWARTGQAVPTADGPNGFKFTEVFGNAD